jgi:putative transposase
MAERGVEVSYETIRLWWNRFGPELAKELGNRRAASGCI